MERKPQGVVEARGVELEQPAGAEACGEHAEEHRRMPALAEAVVAGEAEPRVQLGAHRVGEQELASGNPSQVFRRREQRGQRHAVGVHARRVVLVVEIERMRRGAVGERGARR